MKTIFRFRTTAAWKMPGMRNDRFMKWLFDLIRPLFVRNWDRNEDYVCGHCGRPVLRRFLYCSSECSERHDFEIGEHMRMAEEIDRLKRKAGEKT